MEVKKATKKDGLDLDQIKELLILMKDQGVHAFTYKDLSVNFSESLVLAHAASKVGVDVPKEELDEETVARMKKEQEERDLYGSAD